MSQSSNIVDKELYATHRVLDNGFVRVVDVMGNDEAIVQAARVSYGKGTKTVRDDEKLIRYLMRHEHMSPFEMCEIKLHVKLPIYVWRQWARHRTASMNEVSLRYSEASPEFHVVHPFLWRTQSKSNKQGSEAELPEAVGDELRAQENEFLELAFRVYEERLRRGVAREQARKDLPLSLYTEMYWKIDLRNLLHFLELRMHPSAQHEIRRYAVTIGHQIVANWVPITWNAFLEYRVNKTEVYAREKSILQNAGLSMRKSWLFEQMARDGILAEKDGDKIRLTREGKEFIQKLEDIGIKLEIDS